MHQYFLRVQ